MIDVIKQMVEALEWCHGGEPVGTADAIKAGKQLIAELESQEPVAWIDAVSFAKMCQDPRFNRVQWQTTLTLSKVHEGQIAFYAFPPQRQPLTDEQLQQVMDAEEVNGNIAVAFARAIEQYHGIKGEA